MFVVRAIVTLLVSTTLAVRGYRKQSLDFSGSVAGFITALISMGAAYRVGAMVMLFYLSSSRLTKFRSREKMRLEDGHREGGQRNAEQVLSSSLVATLCTMAYFITTAGRELTLDAATFPISTALMCGVISHYACCTGDTWASELGILYSSKPRLVTSLFWRKRVPRGTNGGISFVGLLASLAGGLFIGLGFWALGPLVALRTPSAPPQWRVMPFSAAMGLIGSLVDSVLGAVLQASWYAPNRKVVLCGSNIAGQSDEQLQLAGFQHVCGFNWMTNEQVNLVSASITTAVGAALGMLVF